MFWACPSQSLGSRFPLVRLARSSLWGTRFNRSREMRNNNGNAKLGKLEFYAWLRDIEDVLEDCQDCLRLEAEINQRSGFDDVTPNTQKRLSQLHWFVLVTQLAKLYVAGSQQHLAFYRLIAALRASREEPWLMAELTSRSKARWRTFGDLDSGLVEMHVMLGGLTLLSNKLMHARNTVTAHTEPVHRRNGAPRREGPSMKDLRQLTRQARRVFRLVLLGFGLSTKRGACNDLVWDVIFDALKRADSDVLDGN